MCCKQQKSAHPIKENRCFMRFFAILGKKQGLPNGSPYGRGESGKSEQLFNSSKVMVSVCSL